jgi:hypothetical protein
MKKMIIVGSLALFLAACGGSGDKDSSESTEATTATTDTSATTAPAVTSTYDSTSGEGKFHDVKINPKLDEGMAAMGEKIAQLKCQACHKMTDEKLVGPGWKGVTKRQKPEWIMNFITNTDDMLNKDPKAKEMLEICMVRMPNQNLKDDEAREVYEFMRKNDGVK